MSMHSRTKVANSDLETQASRSPYERKVKLTVGTADKSDEIM